MGYIYFLYNTGINKIIVESPKDGKEILGDLDMLNLFFHGRRPKMLKMQPFLG